MHCATVDGDVVVQRVTQPDGPDLVVLVVESFEVDAGGEVNATGGFPLVVVATEEIRIAGAINATDPDGFEIGPGGAQAGQVDGNGPGAGVGSMVPTGSLGAGAGSYCGRGGPGGGAAGGEGGPTYGNAELIPLRGGSSAGSSDSPASGGLGGGAIQLVAGVRITIEAGARLQFGGSGARSRGSAGGSGGAILLEAPDVEIDGTLAVNGGSGAGADALGGNAANASGEPAPGTTTAACDYPGGDGSSALAVDGGAGVAAPDCTIFVLGSGGGGGAGRIRVNTSSGELTPGAGAIISPSLDTDCASVGGLMPLNAE